MWQQRCWCIKNRDSFLRERDNNPIPKCTLSHTHEQTRFSSTWKDNSEYLTIPTSTYRHLFSKIVQQRTINKAILVQTLILYFLKINYFWINKYVNRWVKKKIVYKENKQYKTKYVQNSNIINVQFKFKKLINKTIVTDLLLFLMCIINYIQCICT